MVIFLVEGAVEQWTQGPTWVSYLCFVDAALFVRFFGVALLLVPGGSGLFPGVVCLSERAELVGGGGWGGTRQGIKRKEHRPKESGGSGGRGRRGRGVEEGEGGGRKSDARE